MRLVVVFGALDVEVAKPAELAVNVAVLDYGGPFRHASALDFVQFARIEVTFRFDENRLRLLSIFVEELLVVHVVLIVEP